jgi:hypothetical protein
MVFEIGSADPGKRLLEKRKKAGSLYPKKGPAVNPSLPERSRRTDILVCPVNWRNKTNVTDPMRKLR